MLQARSDPKWFCNNALGVTTWERQDEILRSTRDNRRTMVLGCVSSSKTMSAGMAILWWLNAFYPSRVFSIAPTFRQVEINIWGEVGKLYRNAKIPIGGDLLGTELKLDRDWYALGFSTDKPDYLHGLHGPNDLVIVDEAQGIPQPIFDAIENTFAGGNTRLLALCNPNVVSGEVYESQVSKAKLYNTIRISAFDTPNVKEGRNVIPGMITREQVKEWIDTYGEDSDFCRVKVFAKFPKQEPDTLVPIDWMDAAYERGPKMPEPTGVHRRLGVDVARYGDDRNVITASAGRKIYAPVFAQNQSTMKTVGLVRLQAEIRRSNQILVDEIGVGGGVVDRLEEEGFEVYGINVAEKSLVTYRNAKGEDKEKFANLRSELWWGLREAFNPECAGGPWGIDAPRDPELIQEVCSAKWSVDSSGRILVESKKDMKERLGRSPDKADSLMLAVYDPKARMKKPSALMLGSTIVSLTNGHNQKADWM